MAQGETKGAAKHRALVVAHTLPRRRCGRQAVRGYYVGSERRVHRRWEVFTLHAELQGWTGSNTRMLASDMGVLLWMGLEAAKLQGMVFNGRDSQYMVQGADALAMVRARPNRLGLLRTRILNGLQALQALRPHLQPVPMVEAERRLRWQLRTKGFVTAFDVQALARA